MTPKGVDKGRAWLIALAAFVINMILSGINRTSGIFYVALIDVYGISRQQANIPFTLRNCVRNLAGPFVGIIGLRYGVRSATFFGGIAAALGVTLCYLATSVFWISVFWGGLHGLGAAFSNTLFQVTLNQYFLKHRATASGIALSGACIGSFVLPIIFEVILDRYELAGTFLISGGLVMQVLPPSLLLGEPPWIKNPKTINVNMETKVERIEPKQKQDENGKFSHFCSLKMEITDVDIKTVNTNNLSTSENERHFNSTLNYMKPKLEKENYSKNAKNEAPTKSIDISKHAVSRQLNSALKIRTLYDIKKLFSVYKNPVFHIISLSLATYILLYDPVMTIIIDYAKDKGMNDDVGKYLISALSFGDLIGRLCFGWITDREFLTLPKFMLVSHVFQGVLVAVLPFVSSFKSMVAMLVIYGITAGTAVIMFPILIAKYLPSEQPLAMGCVSFFSGIISFGVPSLIGHFRDDVGSYDGMVFISSGISIIVGALWLLEPFLLKISSSHRGPEEI